MFFAPYSGARGTETGGTFAGDIWQQEAITDPSRRLTGGMFAVIPESPIVISNITGIGIQQAERAAASETNRVSANAIDTSLNRPLITVCILPRILEVYL
jgi:hypothetical protein